MLLYVVLAAAAVAATIAAVVLFAKLRKSDLQRGALEKAHHNLQTRFKAITDVEAERDRILRELAVERERVTRELGEERERTTREMEAERSRAHGDVEAARGEHDRLLRQTEEQRRQSASDVESLRSRIAALQAEFNALDEEANLQSFGFYKPRYDFADSQKYQVRLEEIRQNQKSMLQAKTAAVCTIEWTVDGSRTKGRQQTNQTLKLILRAFNGECDAAIAKVKYNNIGVMQTRIRKSWEALNGFVQAQGCSITSRYLELKLDELYLVHEYQEKLQAEKEEQRRIREQMREEEVALREMEKARADAEREEKRYADALLKAQQEVELAVGAKHDKLVAQIEALRLKLAEAHANKERAIARAQMTRSGHVYVISNIGSFGENVFKIGMTRRLDPMERVRELGDASVPFQFDVHAVIWSEDAPSLENTLHRAFNHRRVNLVNERKEFFEVPINEIASEVRKHHGDIDFTLLADAEEYRKTNAIRADGRVVPGRLAIEVFREPEGGPPVAQPLHEGLSVV